MVETATARRRRPASGALAAGEARSFDGEMDHEPFHGESDERSTPLLVQGIEIPDGLPAEGPRRILVVGRTPEAREDTVRALQESGSGWEPDAVADAPTARTRLHLQSWDVVVLRLDAGPLDYREVFHTVRGARHWPPPNVVAVMGADVAVRAELKALGAVEILTAPLTRQALVDAVRRALAVRGAPESGPWWETDRGEETGAAGDLPLI